MVNVLGLGNVLMGDDGFGPAVVRAFEAEYEVAEDVSVIDLGTPGLDLMPWLADVDRVVIVDTIKSDLPAGSLRRYEKRDLLRHPPSMRVGPHDPGVKEALSTLEFAGRAPREVVLIGVVPERVSVGLDLSNSVAAAVPVTVRAVVKQLHAFGVVAVRRQALAIGAPWWTDPRRVFAID
jgi:hydrogenase maturation protease